MSAGNQLEIPCQSAWQLGGRHTLAALRYVLLVATVCHTAVIRADLIDVLNPSFEDVSGGFVFNEFTFGAPLGWQIYDPHAVVLNSGVGPQFWVGTLSPNPPTFFSGPAPHGQRVAIAFNVFSTGNLGEYGLQQTLEATLLANYLYTLQVEIGNIASGTAVNGEFYNLDGFPGYRIDLLAGGGDRQR